MRWEYMVVSSAHGMLTGRDGLNEIGKDGWELVQILQVNNGSIGSLYYYKRPIAEACKEPKATDVVDIIPTPVYIVDAPF